MPEAYVALIANVGLLSLLTWAYSAVPHASFGISVESATVAAIRLGLLFGLCASTLMLVPIRLEDGIFGDARGAPLFLSAFVGGPVAAVVCGAVTAVGRILIGGAGAAAGVVYIIAIPLLGLLFRTGHTRLRGEGPVPTAWMMAYVLLSSAMTAPVILLLPAAAQEMALVQIWPILTLGNVIGVVILGTLIRAVSVQKLALADLDATRDRYHLAEARLRDFAEASSDWLWEMDASLRFTNVSKRFEQLTGVAVSDVVGRVRDDLYGGSADASTWRDHKHSLERREPFRDFQYDLSVPGRETRTIRTSGTPLFAPDGRFLGYRGTASDITEIIKIRTFIYSAFEHSTEPNMVFSPDGIIAVANSSAEALLDYGPGEMVGRQMSDLFSDTSFLQALDCDGRVEARGTPGKRFQLKAKSRAGKELPVELGIGRFDFDSQTFCVGAMHDLTEIERARGTVEAARIEAEKANDAKSHFLATMSHELRTPLNAILGFSEILAGQYLGKPDETMYREYGADINKSASLLLELVNNILDLSAIEAGRWNLDKEWIGCRELISDCSKVLSLRAKTGRLTMIEHISPGAERLFADKRSVRQVLLNILTNAVKFTPAGGQIRVSALSDGNSLVLEVEDTGIGIPKDKLSEVTAFFSHAGANAATREDGWGIGLAITKSLVEMHGGTLSIASEVGAGTTIRAAFPIPENAENRAVA